MPGRVSAGWRLVVIAVVMATAPFVAGHGDGTTGGELLADKDGATVSLTLSTPGLLSAGLVTPATSELSDLFDAKDNPLPVLVENTRLLLVVRAGENVLPATIEPGPEDAGAFRRTVRFRWSPPPASRSFSIERRDPDGTGGLATWMFFQTRKDGAPGAPHFAQALYGTRSTFALAGIPEAGGEAAGEPVKETSTLGAFTLLALGFRHIVPEGLDHVLFILALFLPLPRFRPLVAQATAFTLAHSVTLGLAMSGLVTPPSRFVETVIALSILVMALENLRVKKVGAGRWSLVFLFGLVHGLGFAGSFSQLSASPGDLGRTLLFLNLGIELAQLAVLLGLAVLVMPVREKPWYRRRVAIPVSVIIAFIAAGLVVQRIA